MDQKPKMDDDPSSQPQVLDQSNHWRRHQAEYDFLKGFYQREEIAAQQVRGLQDHIQQLCSAVQHSGRESQFDRLALSKSQDSMKKLEIQMKELDEGFRQSETTRAKIENELHNERQEHRLCVENLRYEVDRHSETEKNLERIWTSNNHLGQIMAGIKCRGDGDFQDMTYNVTELVMELAEKSQYIEELESNAEQGHKSQLECDQLKQRLRIESEAHTSEYMAQEERIRELDLLLRREQVKLNAATEPKQAPKRRRRYRGKSRSSQEDIPIESVETAHTEPQDYVGHTDPKSYGGLPVPQGYGEHAVGMKAGVWREDWQRRTDDCQTHGLVPCSPRGLATVEEEST